MQVKAAGGAHLYRMESMSEVAAISSFDRNGRCGITTMLRRRAV